jgi:hypothetical protein
MKSSPPSKFTAVSAAWLALAKGRRARRET